MDLVVVPASSAQASASAFPAVPASVSALSSQASLFASPRQIAQFFRRTKRKDRPGLDN